MKRRQASKSHSAGKKGGEGSGTQKQKPAEQASRSRSLWTFVFMVVILLAGAVYLAMSSDYSGKHRDRDEEEAKPQSRNAEESREEEEWTDSGFTCDQLMEEAKVILDNGPKREWEYALDLLATCALQEPENPSPRWNLAVSLIQMNRIDEALHFVDEALSLDPSNVVYLKTGGAFLSKMGYHDEAIKCLEWFMEVQLHVASWEQLLASISVQREDEWAFLYDAGEDVISVFEVLLNSYLQSQSLIKAGYLYKILIGLKGPQSDRDLLAAYSFFSFGLGDVVTGIKYLRMYTEYQYIAQGYGDEEQAYEVVTAHSLRLFTAGFDSHIISIGRNLLMAGQVVWDELVYNCKLTERDVVEFATTVRQSDLRRIFVKCLIAQKVVTNLLEEGAVVYAENIFGWTPILHAAALGSPEILHQIIKFHGDPQSRTALAHTSLHIAAIRGSFDVVLPLIQAGLKPSEVDYFNRTALQVACLQRWSAEGMADAIKVTIPYDCPVQPQYAPPLKHTFHGGWVGSGVTLPQELTKESCDFDVLTTADVRTFLFEYLALQRPVIIRDAASSHEMKALFQTWQRAKFEQEYGSLTFNEVEVPYAESFGYGSNRTTIKDFMTKMKQVHQKRKEASKADGLPHPTYIFESIPLDSPLLKNFKLPQVLNPNLTHISMAKTQFYLGPALSGAPAHFHRSAWNVLIYGQKRWFLFPPDRAFYSKQHVWDWWQQSYRKQPSAFECVQYQGDMVFVPDMWGHAVINLRESVGVAAEFVYGASEFSI